MSSPHKLWNKSARSCGMQVLMPNKCMASAAKKTACRWMSLKLWLVILLRIHIRRRKSEMYISRFWRKLKRTWKRSAMEYKKMCLCNCLQLKMRSKLKLSKLNQKRKLNKNQNQLSLLLQQRKRSTKLIISSSLKLTNCLSKYLVISMGWLSGWQTLKTAQLLSLITQHRSQLIDVKTPSSLLVPLNHRSFSEIAPIVISLSVVPSFVAVTSSTQESMCSLQTIQSLKAHLRLPLDLSIWSTLFSKSMQKLQIF